jgi:glycosyltransferase involved in cell wall biosynthesis
VPRYSIFVTGLRGIPGVIGGVESHCEELLPRIAALAPDLTITVLARRGFVDPAVKEYEGIKVVPLPSPSATSTEAIGATALAVIHAWRARADLLHIHAIGPALLAPFARMLGLRVVVTHHGRDYDRAKWGAFAKRMLRLGERLGVTNAQRTIAVAPTLAEDLRRTFPACSERIRYVPNGAPDLEDSRSSEEVLDQFGLEPRTFILAVGRFVPEKGFDYLVRAYRRSGTDRPLVIVGSPLHDSEFARQLLEQADSNVRLIGNQPRSVLRRLYENADLFVLPSSHEGLAISALEAAQCGAPMLLSDIGPNRDLGLPARNYFPVGDEDALADALARSGDEFTYDVAELTSRFEWNSIAAQTLEIYREVLVARSGARADAS